MAANDSQNPTQSTTELGKQITLLAGQINAANDATGETTQGGQPSG